MDCGKYESWCVDKAWSHRALFLSQRREPWVQISHTFGFKTLAHFFVFVSLGFPVWFNPRFMFTYMRLKLQKVWHYLLKTCTQTSRWAAAVFIAHSRACSSGEPGWEERSKGVRGNLQGSLAALAFGGQSTCFWIHLLSCITHKGYIAGLTKLTPCVHSLSLAVLKTTKGIWYLSLNPQVAKLFNQGPAYKTTLQCRWEKLILNMHILAFRGSDT